MNTSEVITLMIALYGALLSTFVFVAERLDQRPRVRVSANLGFMVGLSGSEGNLLFLEAVNVGRVEVTLSSWSFLLPDSRKLIFPMFPQRVSFPFELAPGKSCTVYVPLKLISEGLVSEGLAKGTHLIPQFMDQTGKVYLGKYIEPRNS